MAEIVWEGQHVEVAPPKRPKKLTGTRFASVLGLNHWSTPFEIWCAVTRVYEHFESTKFTEAGKAIQPLQINYMKTNYAMSNLRTPTDVFGEDYFHKTYGDFFPDVPIFGGAWDSILVDENGKPNGVLEFKTSKRAEDWVNDIPEYYAEQAALYAYLLGVDDVIMVASFLQDSDYDHPEQYVPTVHNTITRPFKVSERYPDFADRMQQAIEWWAKYVETGISPDYDEDKDAEILKALRTVSLSPDTDLNALLAEAETLKEELAVNAESIKSKEKRLDEISKLVKQKLTSSLKNGDKIATMNGQHWKWELSRTVSVELDKDRLKEDGLYDKYCTKQKTVDKLSVTKLK